MRNATVVSEADQRGNPRTNLLLSAFVCTDGRRLPVRIRNVSECGALLEGDGLPVQGQRLQMVRGDLEVSATVAWASGTKRGVRFDQLTAVESWTAGRLRVIDCTGLRDQRRVDAVQLAARNGTMSMPPASDAAATPIPDLDNRIADELGFVQRLLETMGDELVGDPAVVHRHLRCLQSVDLASQILTHLAAILRSDDQAHCVANIGMDDLRARLRRRAM